jgi:hypothetical protein
MGKKLVLALLLLLSSCGIKSALAQSPTPTSSEFNFEQAYKDFVFTFDQYRSRNTEYALARSQYMQSKTLASQQKAQEGTYNMLFARDEAVRTYLTAIRMRVAEAIGVPDDKKLVLRTRLDTEVAWFENHKSTLSSAESLDDQTADSNVARDHYSKTSTPLIYESLMEIAIGKVKFLRDQQSAIVNDLEAKLVEIRGEGEIDTGDMERGVLEVRNRISRSEAKESDARKLLVGVKQQEIPAKYSQVTARMGESLQYLKEANIYLDEMIRRIKYGQ